MIRIEQLKLRPDQGAEELRKKIAKTLRISPQSDFTFRVARKSVDARRKPELFYVYTVDVRAPREKKLVSGADGKAHVRLFEPVVYAVPEGAGVPLWSRPVIAGSGPAGLFCALALAKSGFRPVVLERGKDVESRTDDVRSFWQGGALDPESNVQFGEGGAGTFSDGKLNTGIKDPDGRNRYILETFVRHGAGEDILTDAKPHVGTDVLRGIVRGIREEIIRLGGTFLFGTRLDDIERAGESRAGRPLWRLYTRRSGAEQILETEILVLAVGHSARDTFEMLKARGFLLEAKAFAVGVRVQHPQAMIDRAMYGDDCPYDMPPSPYSLTGKAGGRGIYSFCMCPGGYVVNASSEQGRLAVNGMSYHDRGSGTANSAIVVTTGAFADGNSDPLCGVRFARTLETKAFAAGRGNIPLQRYEDFRENREGALCGSFAPAVKGLFSAGNLRTVFPEEINDCLIGGIRGFGTKIRGFDHPDCLLAGVESRTSSPVRILRGENGCAAGRGGIYPCGEGAGYAGGIVSAAADGLRTAEHIALSCRPSMSPLDFHFD